MNITVTVTVDGQSDAFPTLVGGGLYVGQFDSFSSAHGAAEGKWVIVVTATITTESEMDMSELELGDGVSAFTAPGELIISGPDVEAVRAATTRVLGLESIPS